MKKNFKKGHRSIVYICRKNVVKTENPNSKAINRLENEAHWLSLLNQHGIGPKLIKKNESSLTLELINGIPIVEWLEKSSKHDILPVMILVLKQCRILDELHVNKYEMTNPYKHIIIMKNIPTMIDFERCKLTMNPKNVTQFCQFIMSRKVSYILAKKGMKISSQKFIELLKSYKTNQSKNNFNKILKFVSASLAGQTY